MTLCLAKYQPNVNAGVYVLLFLVVFICFICFNLLLDTLNLHIVGFIDCRIMLI